MKNFLDNYIVMHLRKVEAGFPSPADNYIEEKLNIEEYLIKNKESTFLVKAAGESMLNVGIFPGDILVVDRSLEVKNQSIVIASINGDLTVKRISQKNKSGEVYLQSENIDYPDIKLNEESNIMIWGIVTHSIHHLT